MRNESMPPRRSIAITAALAAAFCVETYVGSGWQSFKWNSGKDRQAPTGVTNERGTRDLQGLLDHYLHCETSPGSQISDHSESHQLSVWLSPYRRFPEVASEGDNRGKGDYEYFSYIANNRCGRIASSYGTFKHSPADQAFQKASKQSLRAELLLAQKLGYTLFALDTRKIFLITKDRDLCRGSHGACTETSDGFMVISLKTKAELTKNPDFLLRSARMGDGLTLIQAIEAHSITATRDSQWHHWEYPQRGSAFRWNNAVGNQSRSVEILTPTIGGESPANLETIITANPSVKSLLVELVCTRGKHPRVMLTIQGSRDISKIVNRCLPKSIKTVRAINQNNLMTNQAPQLGKADSRQAFFGIMYRLR